MFTYNTRSGRSGGADASETALTLKALSAIDHTLITQLSFTGDSITYLLKLIKRAHGAGVLHAPIEPNPSEEYLEALAVLTKTLSPKETS